MLLRLSWGVDRIHGGVTGAFTARVCDNALIVKEEAKRHDCEKQHKKKWRH